MININLGSYAGGKRHKVEGNDLDNVDSESE